MRDKLKTKEYFDGEIEEINKVIDSLVSSPPDEKESFELRFRLAFHLNTTFQEKIITMYSRGDALADIKPVYLEFLDNFEALVDLAHEDIDYIRENYAYSLDKFYRLVSWAILFDDVDLQRRKEFVEDLDFFGQQKTGDIMLAKAGLVDRKPIDRLGGKPAFEPLLHALEAETPGMQEVALSQFLKNWYKAMSKMNVAWIDNHKSKHDIYFGYWCFEAAAAVKVLGLDADVFKNTPYFPYDLVAGSK